MKKSVSSFSVLIAFSVVFGVFSSVNASATVPGPTALLAQFKGNWSGTGMIESLGNPTLHLTGGQKCKVVANENAIQCTGHWEGEGGFVLDEAIQGGYDVASDKINWQVVYSLGTAFTVLGGWNTAGDTLTLGRSFASPGGTVDEVGSWTFANRHNRSLIIEDSIGSTVVQRFTASVSK